MKHINKKPKVAEQIIGTIEDQNIVLFHDNLSQGYASIDGTGIETHRIKSKAFKQWVRNTIWTQQEKTISSETFKEVLETLESKAVSEGEKYSLNVRTARTKDTIYYDLGREVVRITKKGWEITTNPPILFKRFPHMADQVKPVAGGKAQDLLEFVNLEEKGQQILFLTSLAASFIPGWPHPISVVFGTQGSAKSTLCRVFKDLSDPSVIKDLSAPRDEKSFIQTASHHWVLNLDNLSYLPDWLSDSISRAVTGSGFSKRELFSDDEDFVYSFKRVVLLNGITAVAGKPDILDRSILFNLERIPDNKRRKEAEFWKAYRKAKPKLLGALFTAVSEAMGQIGEIDLKSFPRMADFADWGAALANPLGYSRNEFLRAYDQSIEGQHDEALEMSPVGIPILDFLKTEGKWTGTASGLLKTLEDKAEVLNINTKAPKWPKTPAWLVKNLEIIKHNLKVKGVSFNRGEGRDRRKIFLSTDSQLEADVKEVFSENPATEFDSLGKSGTQKNSKKGDR